jgi:hypothetical protein
VHYEIDIDIIITLVFIRTIYTLSSSSALLLLLLLLAAAAAPAAAAAQGVLLIK